MTVSNATNRVTFAGNGATTSFGTTPVKFFASSDLLIYVTVNATGVTTQLTEGTHYTVSGGDTAVGAVGTVNTAGGSSPHGAVATGSTLVIIRELPLLQGADFVQNDSSNADVAEAAIDKIVMNLQRLDDKLDRSLVVSDGDVSGANFTVPTPVASTVLGWNSTATALQNYVAGNFTPDILVSAFMKTLLDDVDATTARATLGAVIGTNVQAWDADLDQIAAFTRTAGDLIVGGASAWTRKAAGSDGETPVFDSTQADKLSYVQLGAGSVRQSVLSAALDANGYNAAITTGSGLRPGLDASPTPMVLAFASGFGKKGAQDLVSTLSADAADVLGANLSTSNTAFLHATYSTIGAVTWGQALIPPQYGYAFDRTQGALLNFEGADASTTMLDDFGNTWAANGNAQIDTAQFKFGTSSLLLDGTGDYVESTNFTTLGDGSWEVSMRFRINALPGAGAIATLFCGTVAGASNIGAHVTLFNNAGTTKIRVFLSSNGTSHDIVNGGDGANTVWTLNQWNKVRFVFDALAGTYRVYLSLNDAAETQDYSLASTARVCGIGKFRVGANGTAGDAFNGWIDAFRFLRAATVTATETPAAVAPTITDYPVHFFSIPEMKMYEVTAASASAGVNPTMTQRNRLFVAEADTSGAAVTAVRNYALQGKYVSEPFAHPAASTTTVKNHNIGTAPLVIGGKVVCTTSGSLIVGDEADITLSEDNTTAPRNASPFKATRNTMTFRVLAIGTAISTGSGMAWIPNNATGTFAVRLFANRGW